MHLLPLAAVLPLAGLVLALPSNSIQPRSKTNFIGDSAIPSVTTEAGYDCLEILSSQQVFDVEINQRGSHRGNSSIVNLDTPIDLNHLVEVRYPEAPVTWGVWISPANASREKCYSDFRTYIQNADPNGSIKPVVVGESIDASPAGAYGLSNVTFNDKTPVDIVVNSTYAFWDTWETDCWGSPYANGMIVYLWGYDASNASCPTN